jgi:hypothetical protein
VATVVDLSFKPDAPVRGLPYRIALTLNLQNPSDKGLTAPEEAPTIEKLQDRITQLLCGNKATQPVGIVTKQGRRTLYLYAPTASIDTASLNTAFIFYPQYRDYGLQIEADSDWVFYTKTLYPSAKEFVKIQNTRIIKALVLNGDRLSLPRQVDHFVAFATEKDGKAFYKKVKKQDYIQLELSQDTARAPSIALPWVLHLARNEVVNPPSVEANTLLLFEMAATYKGSYLGWQTTVVRMAAPAVPR